jgi:hypothetical protein
LSVSGSPPFISVAQVGQNVVITWSGPYTLLSASSLTGQYLPVAGATSPYTNVPPLANQRYFGLGQ